MRNIVLVLIGFVMIIAAVMLFLVYNHIINKKVLASSKKISKLLELNKSIGFYNVADAFAVRKEYDNKRNFLKAEPAYLMAARLREDIGFFSNYTKQILENRKKLEQYEAQVYEILQTEFEIDYDELRIKESSYKRRERKLFFKQKLDPVTDCDFDVEMEYSSPKGQVTLSKEETFGFDDLLACFESISRSKLDRMTYEGLAAVERGEVSDSLRYDILQRDNFKCVICGASAKQGARLHIDHIIPISKGGKSVPENLRTLCERCNIGKSNKIEKLKAGNEKENKNICPWCGGELALKKGKYGKFYGCSNFPKCKYTKNINETESIAEESDD